MKVASRFSRYELRATDVPEARAFYTEIFGEHFWSESVVISLLPEQAIARGAPPHWLGHLGVEDVDATKARLIALGAQQLGPSAILRDPFGAVVALASPSRTQSDAVAWRLLHVEDHARAYDTYAKLFGWSATGEVDLGAERGSHRMFAWDESGRTVGSVASTARQPHIHTQWMYFFRVASLDDAAAKVRARGGLVVDVTTTAHGDRVAPCDDPQGAAFGLFEQGAR